ncbi:MAG: hypothetical protein OXI57_04295 [Rhodospirillales bacterium]|nr:hypothetical protein [Rhodospirillales bacterium]
MAPDKFSRAFRQRDRGLVGMEVALRGKRVRLAPTHMLASNLRFDRARDSFLEKSGATVDDLAADGRLLSFSARQYLLPGGGEGARLRLFRGGPVIAPMPSAGEDRAGDLADGIGQWMVDNLSAEGALPYKYWPSQGAESPSDNAIRQFLATRSLAQLGELRGSADMREAARRNLRFNLNRYFQDIGGGRGAIVEETGAKLGAAALAALTILESPARQEFLPALTKLAAGVASLADHEHGFRTFFFPPERDGANWNFYSGEALLFWAEALRRGADCAPSLEQCADVFARCRARHCEARNPAFVPWHTQACTSLFAHSGRLEFVDFAFEISDWLLPMQQWDGLPTDLRGRFYNPKRPEFGPPHASSTGVYLEGFADAAALARAVGDHARASTYDRAIRRGLRSLRQLQFRDERDAFYVSRKKRVMGALRTEVYDNAVRVDSAAHALTAAIKIMRPMEFAAG